MAYLRSLALLIAGLVLLPLITLLFIAITGGSGSWQHLISYVIPSASLHTLVFLLGVGTLASLWGLGAAVAVNFFAFPGRRALSLLLIMPLAVPTYLAAYTLSEFASFTGPVQSALRWLMSYESARDYYFPDLRTWPGGVIIFASVLYPYIYLSVLASIRLQNRRLLEVARVLQASGMRVLFSVLIPLLKPGLLIGLSLCLMETLNDVGAVEYLGLETLTFAVFTTWISQGDLSGAAQLSFVLFLFVAVLLGLERWASFKQKLYTSHISGCLNSTTTNRQKLQGWRAAALVLFCLLPVTIGFAVPFLTLLSFIWVQGLLAFSDLSLWSAVWSSFWLSGVTAVLTVLLALVLAYFLRSDSSPRARLIARLASIGYAVPGAVLALGLFVAFSAFDNSLDSLMRTVFGYSSGLLVSGSGVLIIYAYSARLLTVAEGTVSSSLSSISPSIDQAAQIMGQGLWARLKLLHLPLLGPTIASAGLMVFIDATKELSATLFLRPFGLNTLATHLYDYASQARVEEGAAAALIIMALGLLSVIWVSRSFTR